MKLDMRGIFYGIVITCMILSYRTIYLESEIKKIKIKESFDIAQLRQETQNGFNTQKNDLRYLYRSVNILGRLK